VTLRIVLSFSSFFSGRVFHKVSFSWSQFEFVPRYSIAVHSLIIYDPFPELTFLSLPVQSLLNLGPFPPNPHQINYINVFLTSVCFAESGEKISWFQFFCQRLVCYRNNTFIFPVFF